ncbi:helix-turn-helix domain-containing protein [Streptomyces sp. NPDC001068]|uniref:helix-turn-helix domain-containing protein n=1 Tax=Streptomyces sp. NPDC001068 TaxID=3364544 RepID=UPI00368A60C9
MTTETTQRYRYQPLKGAQRDRIRAEAAEDYESGSSIRSVAARLTERYGSVSFGLARDLLLEAEVPLRSKTSRLHRTRLNPPSA